jgi:ubiquinone/menaquinone biosynthesis C-methylase UbiE
MDPGNRSSDYTQKSDACEEWESAYLRFETPQQEVRKFRRRLVALGALAWPREAAVVELFCGRGSGLLALAELGFRNIHGIDLSPALVSRYRGTGSCVVADCRRMPLRNESQSVAVVQGGLHHLLDLPEDLELTLAEARRVLKPDGRLVAVEPWLTPFLRTVHGIARVDIAGRAWPRLGALATMIRLEGATYERWLAQPQPILALLAKHFVPLRTEMRWGKLSFVGRKRPYAEGD